MGDPATRARATAIMQEVVSAAAACGHPLPAGTIAEMTGLTDNMAPYHPSMMLDLAAGREIELDAIYAEPLRRGTACGASMPLTEELFRQLNRPETSRR